jgi:hypothetical protein
VAALDRSGICHAYATISTLFRTTSVLGGSSQIVLGCSSRDLRRRGHVESVQCTAFCIVNHFVFFEGCIQNVDLDTRSFTARSRYENTEINTHDSKFRCTIHVQKQNCPNADASIIPPYQSLNLHQSLWRSEMASRILRLAASRISSVMSIPVHNLACSKPCPIMASVPIMTWVSFSLASLDIAVFGDG